MRILEGKNTEAQCKRKSSKQKYKTKPIGIKFYEK